MWPGGLADGILCKVDRASMAVGLEVHVPLLDWRVVQFGWSLPLQFKWRGGTRKLASRMRLHRYVPATLVERPKQGFGAPVVPWLRSPLRDWAEALLEDFLRDQRKWHIHLWSVLMFQAWREAVFATPLSRALNRHDYGVAVTGSPSLVRSDG